MSSTRGRGRGRGGSAKATGAKRTASVKPSSIQQPPATEVPVQGIEDDDPTKKYVTLEQREQIYLRPGMWIGTIRPESREQWLYNPTTNKMERKETTIIPAVERLYLEILSNASDAAFESREAGVNPKKIEVWVDDKSVRIKNYGAPLPVMRDQDGDYIPKRTFGRLNTSSTYNQATRHGIGQNGIGAKATNIFSTLFKVEVCDAVRNKKYVGVWQNNMKEQTTEEVTDFKGKESSVEVYYELEFGYFKLSGYDDVYKSLFERHAIDISYNTRIKTSFNDREFECTDMVKYAALYFDEEAIKTSIKHYEWPAGTEITKGKNGVETPKNPAIIPTVEVLYLDTPDDGKAISFVNSMMTIDGGIHVDSALRAFAGDLIAQLNEKSIKQAFKGKKDIKLTQADKKSYNLTLEDVRPHVSMIVSVRVNNPEFDSQSKTKLKAFKEGDKEDDKTITAIKITIDPDELKGLNKWQLKERLEATIKAKLSMKLSKTDGKLSSFVKLKGMAKDANNAGTKKRADCALYICEGNSAASYINNLLEFIEGNRDNVGILPIRGKMLNVMNASVSKMDDNSEIETLKSMLGLVEYTDYTDDANFKNLRYGQGLMIFADADVDGKHIVGLVINYFYCRFPSLLKRGYVKIYMTPILRVWKGKTVLRFYSESDYDEWRAKTPDHNTWKHKYFKGLATSTKNDIEEDSENLRVSMFKFDDKTDEKVKLAFAKENSDERKQWIEQWKPILGVDKLKEIPVSLFIDAGVGLYSLAAIQRAIPHVVDGMKDSQRKIVWAAYLEWKSFNKKDYPEVGVDKFAAQVSKTTPYHHGAQNLEGTITGMAAEFVGSNSNNIPYFEARGGLGGRYEGGEDAAAGRYPKIVPHPLLGYIIRNEDMEILNIIKDEESESPQIFYPIIPIGLVNGVDGIATGYSTKCPAHNPFQIIEWLRHKNNRDPTTVMVSPYYRGYKGDVKLIKKGSDLKAEFTGKFTITDGVIVITEIPITTTPGDYKLFLDTLYVDKVIGSKPKDNSVGDTVRFEISGWKGASINIKNLKLVGSISMNNMHFLNAEDKPQLYQDAEAILEEFYKLRLPIYQKRKDHQLKQIKKNIKYHQDMMRFIRAVREDQLVIVKRKKDEIFVDMDKMELPREFLTKTTSDKFSNDELEKLQKQIDNLSKDYDNLDKKPIEEIWNEELDELEAAIKKHWAHLDSEAQRRAKKKKTVIRFE